MESLQALVDWLAENESAFSAVAAIAVIAGVLYGALRFVLQPFLRSRSGDKSKRGSRSSEGAQKPAKATNISLGDSQRSLAVLLFEPLSENKDDEFLASGITSEVIAHVTQIPNIRVSSRLSSFSYKSGRDDIDLVAEQLNARYILTGSLRRMNDRIMVIAQLTDTQRQSEIWAQTYDRQVEDLFDVQHDIARCIVGAVLGEVRLAESLLAGATPDHKLDAWGLVQKAYHFWLSSFTAEGILQASQYLRQAIEIDPNYSSARAALAMLISQTLTSRLAEDYDASLKEASELIETAYQQAPNDIDVLENAGVVWLNIGEVQRAELTLRRVNEMAPLNLISRGYLSLLLAVSGGEEGANEALTLLAENFATAPKHPSAPYWSSFQAIAEQAKGNHDIAIAKSKESLIGQPAWVHAYYVMANSQCELGQKDAAASTLKQVSGINPLMSAELYEQNMILMCGGQAKTPPFIEGFRKCGFIE